MRVVLVTSPGIQRACVYACVVRFWVGRWQDNIHSPIIHTVIHRCVVMLAMCSLTRPITYYSHMVLTRPRGGQPSITNTRDKPAHALLGKLEHGTRNMTYRSVLVRSAVNAVPGLCTHTSFLLPSACEVRYLAHYMSDGNKLRVHIKAKIR